LPDIGRTGLQETALTDESWLNAMVPRLYDELRALAHAHLRRERGDLTFVTTAIVHEAWLRLAGQHSLGEQDTGRFFRIASATMRRVLVDHARRRRRLKRNGGAADVALDEVEAFLSETEAEELVALDDALERLGRANPRAAEVVAHRYFGGLSIDETATLLGVSTKTVNRDWLAARAWLRKEVAADLGHGAT
jgi:RNA polymerase sigma-70 factor (ECF subfamily)